LNLKYLKIIEFIPVCAFGIVVRLTSEIGVNWKLAFIVGACFATMEKALLLVIRFPFFFIFIWSRGSGLFNFFGISGQLLSCWCTAIHRYDGYQQNTRQ
jgi:hypothetical protein